MLLGHNIGLLNLKHFNYFLKLNYDSIAIAHMAASHPSPGNVYTVNPSQHTLTCTCASVSIVLYSISVTSINLQDQSQSWKLE